MRVISNAEAREMSDTREIMAAALWAYIWYLQNSPDTLSKYGPCSMVTWMTYEGFPVIYERESAKMWVEAYDKKRELVKIMIFE